MQGNIMQMPNHWADGAKVDDDVRVGDVNERKETTVKLMTTAVLKTNRRILKTHT